MDQRLAAGDRHHLRAAFVDRVETVPDREALVEDGIRIVDLAAADASQIAAKQRLEHQHQRIALAAQHLLLDKVGADLHFLEKWDFHNYSFCSNARRTNSGSEYAN